MNQSISFTTGFFAGQSLSVAQIQAMKDQSGSMLFMQPVFLAYVSLIGPSGKKVRMQESDPERLTDPHQCKHISILKISNFGLIRPR